MSGIFGVLTNKDCAELLIYGTDYHSHLGTQFGGVAVKGRSIVRKIKDISSSQFKSKFSSEIPNLPGSVGIGVISADHVQPVLLIEDKVRPFLNNRALYLAILMKDKEDPSGEDHYAIIKIPSDSLPRFIELPSKGKSHEIIILDDIVRLSVRSLFPGYEIMNTYSIKLTRDAELYIDDEYQGDLINKIKKSLLKRDVGPASRLVYDKTIPAHFLEYLLEVLEVEKLDLIPEGRYHNNFDLTK